MKTQLLVVYLSLCACYASAQQVDSLTEKAASSLSFPNRFIARIGQKSDQVNNGLDRKTARYLHRLDKMENKFRRELTRRDSTAAAAFAYGAQGYQLHTDKVQSAESGATAPLSGEYLPYVDSVGSSLSYLRQNATRMSLSASDHQSLNNSMSSFEATQAKLQASEQAKAFITARKEQMKAALLRLGNDSKLTKTLDAYSSQAYSYSDQLRQYKQTFSDPDKLVKQTLSVLGKVPAFQNFMKSNAQLAGLFGLTGGADATASVSGMQTRDQVQALIQGQIAAGGSAGAASFQSNVQSAKQGLDKFKDKLSSLGQGSGDMEMPDFKPNSQKTKPFWHRLEMGTNVQSTKTNYFFPSTTDMGLSIGYKLSDKSTVGIGSSYKMGWGTTIRHIQMSSQGTSARSFLDVQLKKTFYVSGGYEMNYQRVFASVNELKEIDSWTKSGLIGISKIVSMKGKFLKKTKLQCLWDFLSYSQSPRTQPFKFRTGYTF